MDLVEPMECQQNASLLAKNKIVVVAPPPSTCQTPLLATFFLFQGMNQDLKGRCIAVVVEVQ